MKKVIKSDHIAIESLKKGIDFAADRVKITLGPAGRNTIIGRPFQSPEITNDGKSTLDAIYLEDEIEQLAVDSLKEIAKEQFDESEDGTTTATTLAQAILNYGFEQVKVNPLTGKKTNVMKLRADILKASEEICELLDTKSRQITTLEEIKQVAFVSVENEEIAQIIAEIFFKVGKDGLVTVEEGFAKVESEIVDGMEIEAGLFSDKLANEVTKFVMDNPKILVTNEPLGVLEQVAHLTAELSKNKIMHLVILCDNFSNDFKKIAIEAKYIYGFSIIPIKTPFFGKSEQLEDIAISVGAKFIDKDTMQLTSSTVADLGTVDKITITKDKTIIVGAKGDTKKRIADIQMELYGTENSFDKKQLEKRMARLMGKVGIIRVGADSNKERTYLMKKIKNAVGATKNALKEGVVKGGGVTFLEIAKELPDNILAEAIKAPYNQIMENAGEVFEIDDSIVDPVKTEKSALKIASSVASLILTIGTAIANKQEEEKDFKD